MVQFLVICRSRVLIGRMVKRYQSALPACDGLTDMHPPLCGALGLSGELSSLPSNGCAAH